MEITCKYHKTLYRDEGTGFTIFSVIPENEKIPRNDFGVITIKGRIQTCVRNMPLLLICEPDTEDCTYLLDDYKLLHSSRELTTDFLTNFKGVGPVTAKKITKKYDNIFELCKEKDAVNILTGFGISGANAAQLVSKVQTLYQSKYIFELILKYGGSYAAVVSLIKLYKDKTIEHVNNNPFLMQNAGIPFRVCEQVANEKGFGQYNIFRLQALVTSACKHFATGGHTKISFQHLCECCAVIEKDAGNLYHTSPFYLAGGISNEDFIISEEDNDFFVYTKENYNLELSSAMHINRIKVNHFFSFVDENIITEIEKEYQIQYSAKQKDAFKLIETPGIKVLTGGPGTGKTTVINGIIYAFKKAHPDSNIILCAPTGCAAKRLSYATNEPATTIHKLLGVQPTANGFMQKKNENSRLNAGLIIVDESSMLDAKLFNMLLCAVNSGAVVLLSGDEDQLPPVGQGNILHDLLNTDLIEKCRLKEVFRQKGNSLIVENSIRIRDGMTKLKEGADFEIIQCVTDKEMMQALQDEMQKLYSKENIDETKVYIPVKSKKYNLSTFHTNIDMHNLFNKSSVKDTLVYHEKSFSKDDPVIFMSNNYKLGYYNGDTGVVTAVLSDETSKSLIVLSDGKEFVLSGADLKDVELAYAITTHKSQGSECENAIILLPENPSNMLTRSLIYVAATRAKKKNVIITQGNALIKAIQNKHKTFRYTGLKNRLEDLTKR